MTLRVSRACCDKWAFFPLHLLTIYSQFTNMKRRTCPTIPRWGRQHTRWSSAAADSDCKWSSPSVGSVTVIEMKLCKQENGLICIQNKADLSMFGSSCSADPDRESNRQKHNEICMNLHPASTAVRRKRLYLPATKIPFLFLMMKNKK